MSPHNQSLGNLVRASQKVKATQFSQLVTDVTELMSEEDGEVGHLRVRGRLVELPSDGEAIVIGDLHGDFDSLVEILKASDFVNKVQHDSRTFLLLLGDYGDRGMNPIEVYHLLLTLKDVYRENVILMRGNHECPEDLQVSPFDLPVQLISQFGEDGPIALGALKGLFNQLHVGTLLKGKCIFLHGGVPSKARSLEDIAFAHAKHPSESHLTEILWSDPEEDIVGAFPSPRGAGKLFGPDVTKRFLKMLDVNVLVRGHEPAAEGFKINHDGRVLTLFSRKGEPYFNDKRAFLQFTLSTQISNAFQLVPFVHVL